MGKEFLQFPFFMHFYMRLISYLVRIWGKLLVSVHSIQTFCAIEVARNCAVSFEGALETGLTCCCLVLRSSPSVYEDLFAIL